MALQRFNKHMVSAVERTGSILRSRYGIWGLAAISFIEAALIVPIITDPFLIAYILSNKKHTIRAILVTIFASVLGGVVAYLVAVGFFEVLLSPYISEVTRNSILTTASNFKEGAFLLTVIGAITPFPYTFVALAAGMVQSGLFLFIIASILGRGFRYATEGFLTYRFGENAVRMVRKQIVIISIICVVAIAVYVFIKFL